MNIGEIELYSTVSIGTHKGIYQGLLLPKEGEYIVLKLKSGYNVGISPDSIKEVKLISPPVENSSAQAQVPEQDKELHKLRILHTGGTIASKVDYETGGVVGKFTPEELIALFPELTKIAQVDAEFLGNLSSDDFRFTHFNKIANAAHKAAQEGINRIIVTSGTDFLHYLSAALSFALKDVPVGVLVVGSQRSSDRGSSDAAMNMACAAQFLAKTNFQGVAVCMHSHSSDKECDIIKGTNARKMHSSARATFKPINAAPLASVSYPDLHIDLKQVINTCEGNVPEKITGFKESLKIGICYSKPNMFADELKTYETYDGLVLAGSGLGHFPITPNDDTPEHKDIQEAIATLAKKIPVVMSVQTIYGRVNLNVYSPARMLKDFGVLGHQSSMITETAYIKLAWLLTNHPDQVAELFSKDIVGEMPKTDLGEFE